MIYEKNLEKKEINMQKYLSKRDYIEDRFLFTKSGDEFFVQTLVYNSPFKERLYNQDFNNNYLGCMRLVDWKRGAPYTWRITDYDDIINSEYLFARKFNFKIDKEIIYTIYHYIKELNCKEEN